jgi:hypothetical protein
MMMARLLTTFHLRLLNMATLTRVDGNSYRELNRERELFNECNRLRVEIATRRERAVGCDLEIAAKRASRLKEVEAEWKQVFESTKLQQS